jgi:hypothetical protein
MYHIEIKDINGGRAGKHHTVQQVYPDSDEKYGAEGNLYEPLQPSQRISCL